MSFFDDGLNDVLLGDLKGVVYRAARNAPRTLQETLGPSEVGHGCPRRLAYSLGVRGATRSAHVPADDFDPWPRTVGVAGHDWLARQFEADNEALGRRRWLCEERVTAWDDVEGGEGTCDLYDYDTETVIDYKIPGKDSFDAQVADGPVPSYQIQPQIYAKGHRNAGRKVRNVAIWLIPKSGLLRKSHLWFRPFDEAIAEHAHETVRTTTELVRSLDVANHPERFELIPINPGSACKFCAHLTANPANPYQCKGNRK